MKDSTITGLFLVGLFAGVLAILLGVLCVIGSYKCHARWGDSGMLVDFGLVSGCRLSEDDGKKWIPADRWRHID